MLRRFSSACLKMLPIAGIMASGLSSIASSAELENYPQVSRLWLCHVNGTLGATKRSAVVAEGSGTMRMLVANHANLEKGQVFAIFRPERLELERESLALEQSLLDSKIREVRLDQQDKIIMLESQKDEAEAELQELTAALALPEIQANPEFKQKIAGSIESVEQKIQRLDTRIEVLEKTIDEDVEVVKLKLDHRRREQEFENIKRNAEQRSPFDGSFTMTEELAGEFAGLAAPYDIEVETADPIGHITDSSSYEVALAEYPPILNAAPLEELVLEIPMPGSAAPLTARFHETRELGTAGVGASRPRMLVFEIGSEDRERAEPLAGSAPFGQIIQNLPEACHLVPKTDLIRLMNEQDKPRSAGWAAMARAVWPDAELIATGHREIALRRSRKPAGQGDGTGPQ